MGDRNEQTVTDELLEPGARVEVRNAFDRSWSPGFTVEELTVDGYRLQRRSDGKVLPRTFVSADVRREHKRSMWWV